MCKSHDLKVCSGISETSARNLWRAESHVKICVDVVSVILLLPKRTSSLSWHYQFRLPNTRSQKGEINANASMTLEMFFQFREKSGRKVFRFRKDIPLLSES